MADDSKNSTCQINEAREVLARARFQLCPEEYARPRRKAARDLLSIILAAAEQAGFVVSKDPADKHDLIKLNDEKDAHGVLIVSDMEGIKLWPWSKHEREKPAPVSPGLSFDAANNRWVVASAGLSGVPHAAPERSAAVLVAEQIAQIFRALNPSPGA